MTTVKLRGGGTITLPASMRKKYNFQEVGSLRLIDVGDGSFFLVPKDSKVLKITDEIAKNLKEDNVTLDDLLQTLDEERKRYFQEHYAEQ